MKSPLECWPLPYSLRCQRRMIVCSRLGRTAIIHTGASASAPRHPINPPCDAYYLDRHSSMSHDALRKEAPYG